MKASAIVVVSLVTLPWVLAYGADTDTALEAACRRQYQDRDYERARVTCEKAAASSGSSAVETLKFVYAALRREFGSAVDAALDRQDLDEALRALDRYRKVPGAKTETLAEWEGKVSALRRQREQRRAEESRRTKRIVTERTTFSALERVAHDLGRSLTLSEPLPVVSTTDGGQVVLKGGSDTGLRADDEVECFGIGDEIVVDGKNLGVLEEPIGSSRVLFVRESLAYVDRDKLKRDPKPKDLCYPRQPDFAKLAILPLLYKGKRTKLAEYLEEGLYQVLSSRGVTLVERKQLARIVAEQARGVSGNEDGAEIGKLAGANTVLIGSVDDTGESLNLNARVVGAADGIVRVTRKATFPKNDVSRRMLVETPSKDDPFALAAQQISEARAAERQRKKKAREALQRAQVWANAGEHAKASKALAAALELDPEAEGASEVADALRNLRNPEPDSASARRHQPQAGLPSHFQRSVPSGEHRHGKKHGVWSYRAPNGSGEDTEYLEGVLHGTYVRYGPGGSVLERGQYKRGIKHGAWMVKEVNGSGEEAEYKDGKRDGRYVRRGPGGLVLEEGEYRRDKRHGLWLSKEPSGAGEEVEYVAGRRHGRYARRGPGGAVLDEGSFRDDKRHGRWVIKQMNGAKEEGRYFNDEKCGVWTRSEFGKVLSQGYDPCPSDAPGGPQGPSLTPPASSGV